MKQKSFTTILSMVCGTWKSIEGFGFCNEVMATLGLVKGNSYKLSVSTIPLRGYRQIKLQGNWYCWFWKIRGVNSKLSYFNNVFLGSDIDLKIDELLGMRRRNSVTGKLYFKFTKISFDKQSIIGYNITMNNNTKAKSKRLNGKQRSENVANSNPRNSWNQKGKVARNK